MSDREADNEISPSLFLGMLSLASLQRLLGVGLGAISGLTADSAPPKSSQLGHVSENATY